MAATRDCLSTKSVKTLSAGALPIIITIIIIVAFWSVYNFTTLPQPFTACEEGLVSTLPPL